MREHSGNEFAWKVLRSMAENGRPAHGVLFYGEKGTGKKKMADDYAAFLQCSAQEKTRPCGKCKACRTVYNHTHPDVFTAQKTGKLGVISVGEAEDAKEGTVRDLRSKLFEYPIEGRNKVIIFPDCTALGSWLQAQNMLLKMLEEPPEYGYIIFTAEQKSIFIETILSRIISLPVRRCSRAETEKILAERGFDDEQIRQAADIYSGNIGKCIDFIENPAEREKAESVDRYFWAMIENDEYAMMKALTVFCRDRQSAIEGITMIEEFIREASLAAAEGDNTEKRAIERETAKKIGTVRLQIMYRAAEKAVSGIKSNLRPEFAMTMMCAESMQ